MVTVVTMADAFTVITVATVIMVTLATAVTVVTVPTVTVVIVAMILWLLLLLWLLPLLWLLLLWLLPLLWYCGARAPKCPLDGGCLVYTAGLKPAAKLMVLRPIDIESHRPIDLSTCLLFSPIIFSLCVFWYSGVLFVMYPLNY